MIGRDVATGCGCGCGGHVGCGCGCKQPARSTAPQPGTFVRPRFFAGQLLTEEDLEALVAYTLGKERLHNRYLVGSGVVCGLDVACVPDLPGSVRVGSGYALDCCGNDIAVACDQTLDVNALVADLPGDAGCLATPLRRRFELVVEYAETPGGLVASYSTGEETTSGCEPSRVHEGYRFSLRCPPATPPPQPPSLLDALQCCLQLVDGAGQRLPRLERAYELADEIVETRIDMVPPPPSADDVANAIKQLTQAQGPDLGLAVCVATIGARVALAARTEGDSTAEARTALKAVCDKLEGLHTKAEDDPLAVGQVAALEESVTSLLSRLTGTFTADTATRSDRLLANGVLDGDRLREAIRGVVADTRNWTLCRGSDGPAHHCADLRDLSRLCADPADPASLRDAAATALRAARQLILDCFCSALNPPCLPCDDPAVPLALLTVVGCEVVDVCTLVRRHPVTGTALRYWLPLDRLHALIESLCCGERDPVTLLRCLRQLLTGPGFEAVRRACQVPGEPEGQPGGREGQPGGSEDRSPAQPASEGAPGVDARLLRMLNSQMQNMRARLIKLEGIVRGQAPDG